MPLDNSPFLSTANTRLSPAHPLGQSPPADRGSVPTVAMTYHTAIGSCISSASGRLNPFINPRTRTSMADVNSCNGVGDGDDDGEDDDDEVLMS